MKTITNIMRENKTMSFLAIGGSAVAGLMQVNLLSDYLAVPQLGVAIGAFAIGNLLYKKNKENGVTSKSFKANAFYALAGAVAMAATKMYDLHATGLVQLAIESVAAYGVVGSLSTLMNKASQIGNETPTKPAKENSNFVMPTREKVQAAMGQVRQKVEEPEDNSEFKPLNLR